MGNWVSPPLSNQPMKRDATVSNAHSQRDFDRDCVVLPFKYYVLGIGLIFEGPHAIHRQSLTFMFSLPCGTRRCSSSVDEPHVGTVS
jgi:hypothetical protein